MHPKDNTGMAYLQPVQDSQEEEIDLGDYQAVLAQFRWLILALVLFALLIGGAYVSIVKPIYGADGLLQVEEKKGGLDCPGYVLPARWRPSPFRLVILGSPLP